MPALPARTQTLSRERTLQGVSSRRSRGGWEIHIRFGHALRYIRHTPRSRADFVIVELEPIGLDREIQDLRGLESVRNESGVSGAPASEVLLRPGARGTQSLEIRFTQDVDFEVKQERDFLSLIIRVRGREASADDARAAALLERGEAAIAAGDYDLAVGIFTKVLSMSASTLHPKALELLGLARQKNGQNAHARAEYQKYLERYPNEDGAARVAQRLKALTTPAGEPREPLRTARTARTEEAGSQLRYDFGGSAALHYNRAKLFPDEYDDRLLDSSQIADLFFNGRVSSPDFEVEAVLDARERFDLEAGSLGDDSRINALFVEFAQREPGIWGNVGRQRGPGGALGRFDGGRIGYRPVDWIDLSVMGGFPLASYRSDRVDTDRYQVGLVSSVLEIADLFDAELYTNLQREAGLWYRAAIGGELRHLRPGRSIYAAFDYDVHFTSLNLATLVADIQALPKLSINTHLEYRNSPFLTLGNALIGQAADSIDDLQNAFTDDQLRDLARDQTGRSKTFSLGARYQFTDAYELTGSWSASDLSSIDGLPGLPSPPATGFEYSYLAQFVAYGLFESRGVSTIGLAVFDGDRSNRYALQLNGRYSSSRRLRINPILRIEIQDVDADADFLVFVPRIRLDYSLGPVVLDFDFAYEVRKSLGSGIHPDEHGYFLYTGIRYDF